MERYEPFRTNAVVNINIEQSVSVGSGKAVRPTRVRLKTEKQREIVLSGIRVNQNQALLRAA